MDDTRFDAMTKAWTLAPRRQVLGVLVSTSLATGLRLVGVREAEATHFGCLHRGDRCQDDTQCCSGICKRHRCRVHDKGICKVGQNACGANDVKCGANGAANCLCYVTTGKAPFCGGDSKVIACTRDEECEAGTGVGSACVPCQGETICVAPCPPPI